MEKWLRKKILELGKDSATDRAALLHIFHGTLNLKEISERAGLSQETLSSLRTQAPFMRLVDTFKKECSREFREDLMINEYSTEEYDSMASDFTMLDEILQMQIKVPLFTHLKDLSQYIKSKKTHGLKIDMSNLKLFRRLFTLFIFIEKYAPTLTSKALSEIKQIAEEIVWPALDMDIKELDQRLSEPVATWEKRLEELRGRLDNLLNL